ncbi:putative ABC transport system permease protein [Streptomyces sp. 2231.1]|uniref:ABC transporter permease n=1 Tax=Streptomyces sp. 2231.1 TaxID=1855347 RepID=UPI000896BB95|nr:FtsX-like permease family protein [Streptomyces sp. 2231.1]SEE71951.1 putative ABC transport system permease protein [Streptomyces sp. 2231.1]
MFRTALRNVIAHKARLLMTMLAVMLGVGFISGTLIFTDTFSNAYKNKSARSFDHVSVAMISKGGDAQKSPLTDAVLKRARELPGAGEVLGGVNGFTALAGKDGKLVGGKWGTIGANYFPGKDGEDPRYPLTSGRAPKGRGEIALDSRTAGRTGYKVGDQVRFSTGGLARTARVSGVFDTDDGSVVAGGSMVLFDNTTAHALLGTAGYNEIDIKAAPGISESALKSRVNQILPSGADVWTGTALKKAQAGVIAGMAADQSKALSIFAYIALFVSIFIIANTFTMLVAQRTRELALMRAVGASRRQVTWSVLTEAGVVGAVAGTAGFLLGVGVAQGLQALFGASLPGGPLVVTPVTMVVALVVGVVVTMLAAWLPSRRAAKVPPVAAMNSVHATPMLRGLLVRNAIGSLIVTLGAVLLFVMKNINLKAVGACVMLVGFIVLTPLLSRPFIAAWAPLLRPFGVTGKLSRLNAVRNPRRTASTASALMIGLALITALTVIATSATTAISKPIAASMKADYEVSMANHRPLAAEVRTALDALPGVVATSPLRKTATEVSGSDTSVSGVDTTGLDKLLSLDLISGSMNAFKGKSVLVDKATADEEHVTTGDTILVMFDKDHKTEQLKIAGVYNGNKFVDGLLAPLSVVDSHSAKAADTKVLVKMKDGASKTAEASIFNALGKNPAIKIQDKEAVSKELSRRVSQMLNVLYGLLAMTVLISVLGVVNTLAMSVFERKHEIGMLRATGLERTKVKQMVRLESMVISLFGALLGIGLGLILAWAGARSIVAEWSRYSTQIPIGRIMIFLAVAPLVGILAAQWPARSAARLNPITAINND